MTLQEKYINIFIRFLKEQGYLAVFKKTKTSFNRLRHVNNPVFFTNQALWGYNVIDSSLQHKWEKFISESWSSEIMEKLLIEYPSLKPYMTDMFIMHCKAVLLGGGFHALSEHLYRYMNVFIGWTDIAKLIKKKI